MYADDDEPMPVDAGQFGTGGDAGINSGNGGRYVGNLGGSGSFYADAAAAAVEEMERRLSVGSNPAPIDANVSDLLGRRPSIGQEGTAAATNELDMMVRRDSLESTAAVLDACILNLTRRRASALGSIGGSTMSTGRRSSGLHPRDLTSPLNFGQNGGCSASDAAGLQSALAARQRHLQMQQAELEKRQQELEAQRRQFLATLQQDPSASQQPTLTGIPSFRQGMGGMMSGATNRFPVMNDNSNNMLSSSGMNDMPLPYDEPDLEPPPRPQPPPMDAHQGQQWWVCQVCNAKAFASRSEAAEHEAVCNATPRLPNSPVPNAGLEMKQQECSEVNPDTLGVIARPICLAMPTDKDWLTPLHCFVRRNCVEVFTATADDVAHPSKGKRKPIQVGQVGIRCPFCHIPGQSSQSRERGSVYFPTTISSIYNATMNLLQRHLHVCTAVPDEIMQKYQTLKADDARSGTSKKYWVESALSLGLVDTPTGIRYSNLNPPPLPRLSSHQHATSTAKTQSDDFFSAKSNADLDTPPTDGETSEGSKSQDASKSTSKSVSDKTEACKPGPLIGPSDKPYATNFSYELLRQMQPCVFTEADRLGKRKGLPAGYAGLACRHCFGGYGSGRFFPSSIKTLSDTSKTLNVLYNHMMKCRKCPQEVKTALEKYRVDHNEQRAAMKFGSQKAFFARIWHRLHGSNNSGLPRSMKQKSPPPPPQPEPQYFMAGPPVKQQQHQQHDPFPFSGYIGPDMSMMGLGGLDVLSSQAASAASEERPSKRRRAM